MSLDEAQKILGVDSRTPLEEVLKVGVALIVFGLGFVGSMGFCRPESAVMWHLAAVQPPLQGK